MTNITVDANVEISKITIPVICRGIKDTVDLRKIIKSNATGNVAKFNRGENAKVVERYTLESEVEVVTLSKKDYQKQQKEHEAIKKGFQKIKVELVEFKDAFRPIMRFMLDHELITTDERLDNQLVCDKLLEYLEAGQKKE